MDVKKGQQHKYGDSIFFHLCWWPFQPSQVALRVWSWLIVSSHLAERLKPPWKTQVGLRQGVTLTSICRLKKKVSVLQVWLVIYPTQTQPGPNSYTVGKSSPIITLRRNLGHKAEGHTILLLYIAKADGTESLCYIIMSTVILQSANFWNIAVSETELAGP